MNLIEEIKERCIRFGNAVRDLEEERRARELGGKIFDGYWSSRETYGEAMDRLNSLAVTHPRGDIIRASFDFCMEEETWKRVPSPNDHRVAGIRLTPEECCERGRSFKVFGLNLRLTDGEVYPLECNFPRPLQSFAHFRKFRQEHPQSLQPR